MILQRDISKLSNRLYTDAVKSGNRRARRIPDTTIERDYCLAWFLCALAVHGPLAGTLAFKGGTALRRIHFGDYRFSEDLDFTLVKPMALEEIFAELDTMFAKIERESGILFRRQPDRVERRDRNDTFYLAFKGPLPSENTVKVDVTKGETLVFDLERKPVLQTYVEFGDIPDDREVLVYSFPEVAIEKTLAVTDIARKEPRDLYDLWYLRDRGLLPAPEEMVDPLGRKLATREGRANDILVPRLVKVEKQLQRAWENRLGHQVDDLPEFGGCFREVRRLLSAFDELRAAAVT